MKKLPVALIRELKKVIEHARNQAFKQINTLAVQTNFEIGRIIVEHEQKGESRAPYGKETLKEISRQLTQEFGKGYSVDSLQLMRLFYLTYFEKIENQKYETVSRNFIPKDHPDHTQKYETASRIFHHSGNPLFKLSWSHYVELIKIRPLGLFSVNKPTDQWLNLHWQRIKTRSSQGSINFIFPTRKNLKNNLINLRLTSFCNRHFYKML
ncbi:MAG TPA: DUF1016 family protein [Bacteroidales bacterium]|nr:DUF1016 family protein [Bacteroidales bacterium]